MIGTTSSADKAKIAHANGCDAVILYTIQDFPLEVMSITKGRGADLILDAVGKPTIPLDLKCANKRGTIVFYGMAGGRPDPIDPYYLYFYRSLRFCGAEGHERCRVMVRRSRKALVAEGWIEQGSGSVWRLTDSGRRAAESSGADIHIIRKNSGDDQD